MTFADKLIALRIKHGLSQEELAGNIGISRQALGKWENGQSLPELAGLIALSRYFTISIDALVLDDHCITVRSDPPPADALCQFLLRAKRSTYAGHAPEVTAERSGAHEFCYDENPFCYRDSYFGGNTFHGQEVVAFKETVIWCMNYSGRTLSSHFSGDFLKLSLRNGTPSMPYRGPRIFSNGDYTYICRCDGCIDWFSGSEDIFYLDELVYSCRFHGGTVI